MQNLIDTIQEIPKDKSVFVFDLDGTLAESKTKIDSEMGLLLTRLLTKYKGAVIGGGSLEQIRSQLPDSVLKDTPVLNNLLLLPLDGGSFYTHTENGWDKIYAHNLTDEERKKIFEAFEIALKEVNYTQPFKIYGNIIEDRGGQVTFSALGQRAPFEEKEKWTEENKDIRSKIVAKLKSYLPDMEAEVAGLTSIDVTKKGIDKKFGIEQIIKYLKISSKDVVFFGDALELDGNDHPALETGVMCYRVNSIQDTKEALKYLLSII